MQKPNDSDGMIVLPGGRMWLPSRMTLTRSIRQLFQCSAIRPTGGFLALKLAVRVKCQVGYSDVGAAGKLPCVDDGAGAWVRPPQYRLVHAGACQAVTWAQPPCALALVR